MKAKTCRRSTCVDMLSFLQPSSASQLLQGQMFEPRWLFTGSLPREMTAIFFASPSNFSWSGKKYQDHHIHIQNLRLKTYYQSPTSLPIFKEKKTSRNTSQGLHRHRHRVGNKKLLSFGWAKHCLIFERLFGGNAVFDTKKWRKRKTTAL